MAADSSHIFCIQKSFLASLIALMDQPYEVCGNFEVWSFEQSKIYMHTDQENIEPGEKGVCNMHPRQYFFHTHPRQSKSYPSTGDILSIIHHSWTKRKLSMIVTTWGIWFIYRLGDEGLSVAEDARESVLSFLEQIGETIYKSTTLSKSLSLSSQRSVPYDDARPFILEYLKNLKILLSIGPYASVKFVSWNKVEKMQTTGDEEWYEFHL